MNVRYQFLAQAKEKFAFLLSFGFRIESEHEGTYTDFRDGFKVCYVSEEVTVQIAYYDTALDIYFRKGGIATSYLFLDHNLYSNASGLAGVSFPLAKLGPVIDRIATDIEMNYQAVLAGDSVVWQKIEKLALAPREKKPYLP